jgi:type I restriction enzyme S subunit
VSSELPQGWASARLGDLVEPIEVADPTRTPDAVFRYIDIGSIDNEALRIGEPKTFSGKDAPSRARRVIRDGDVLFSTVRPYLRNIALASVAHSGCLTSTGISVLRAKPSVLPGYLFRLVSSNAFVEEVGRSMDGTLYPAVRDSDVLAASIPLPPLAEQRRIVERIEALFARTRRARADLERIVPLAALHRRATLMVAASGALTEAWRDAHSDLPATMTALEAVRRDRQRHRKLSKRHRVAAAPEMDLPPSWEWVSPDELASDDAYSIGIGPFGSNLVQSDYRPAGVRLVFVRDIRRERFEEKDARYVTTEKAEELRPHMIMGGEVLITKMGDPPGDTTIYPYGIGPAVITSDCIKLKPDPRLGASEYLAYAIRSRIVAAQIGEITKGVAQQKVSLDSFRRIALPTPPIAEQREIATKLDAFFLATSKLEREVERALALLDRLEQSILTRAFRGELVEQDPNDEPARVELEKLRHAPATAGRGRPRKKTMPATDALVAPRKKGPAVPKNRTDADVKGQPYLANHLRQIGSAATTEDLYKAADLSIADFYKQLSEEVAKGWVKDASGKLEAA